EQQGYACVSLDMTNIGSQTISPLQWYKGIASELWRGFQLTTKIKLKSWWEEHKELSSVQQLNRFISDVILTSLETDKIFILIDEIDSVLSLDFSTDDFFALIRYCYNARAENPDYNRLSFALFGVATPSNLIEDHTRTPFNIGTAIELTGFTQEEATPLVSGLGDGFKNPEIVLQEILKWTGGQPFLTQKLCKLTVEHCQEADNCCLPGEETAWVKDLVTEKIINNWEAQDEPEHLRTIRDRIFQNEALASRLLSLAEQILTNGLIPADNSPEQTYLLLSNLVVKKNSKLILRNLIYQKIFDREWIAQQQDRLRPFGKEVKYWLASNCQDESRLLRGQALQEAQAWAKTHSISQQEYQFLTTSKEQEQTEIRRDLEFQRLQEVETRLVQEQKLAKLQRFLLATGGIAFIFTAALGIVAHYNYRQAKSNAITAKTQEIKANTISAESLFDSDRRFESLVQAIVGNQETRNFAELEEATRLESNFALKQAVYNAVEKNTFSGHQDIVNGVSFSPDGELIASASSDTTVKIWQRNGKLVATLRNHQDSVFDVAFSPNGQLIASVGEDNLVQLWNRQGVLQKTLTGHRGGIHSIAFHPQKDLIASASEDRTVRLWNSQGELLNVLFDHPQEVLTVAFSRDGKLIATGDRDGTLILWSISGKLLRRFKAHQAPIRGIDFNPQNNRIVTGGDDHVAKIWTSEGKFLKTLSGYNASVTDVQFSPDGNIIATSSWDSTIKLWHQDGTLHSNLKGHQARVWRLAWSGDGSTLATAGWDNVVKLWQIQDPLVKTFYGHAASILSVVFHPQSKLIASASDDRTVKLWHPDGTLKANFTGYSGEAYEVAFSNDGELVASGSLDRTIRIWRTDGTALAIARGHEAPVTDVEFTPDGKSFISASFDRTIRFWQLENKKNQIIAIQTKNILAHQAIIYDVDLSKDGELIASISHDRYLKLWKANGELIRSIFADKTGLRTVSISPDKQLIATGGKEQTVKLWNLQGELINTLEGHQAIILDVEFSPDGSKIASAAADETIKIWTKEGKLLTTLRGHSGRVWNVDFSPDGKQIASAAEDKTVKLWDLERILKLDEFDYGCRWIQDYLQTNMNVSPEERNLCN
ncbi:AAA-like domain-containing protein, partial [Hyella patelloides]